VYGFIKIGYNKYEVLKKSKLEKSGT